MCLGGCDSFKEIIQAKETCSVLIWKIEKEIKFYSSWGRNGGVLTSNHFRNMLFAHTISHQTFPRHQEVKLKQITKHEKAKIFFIIEDNTNQHKFLLCYRFFLLFHAHFPISSCLQHITTFVLSFCTISKYMYENTHL